MTLGQQQPGVPRVFHQPAAGLDEARLQAGQRPTVLPVLGATEARAIGHGGIAVVERATGISRSTIRGITPE